MGIYAFFLKRGLLAAKGQWYFHLMRFILYAFLVGGWSYVWSMVPADQWRRIGVTWADLVWYLAIAEVIPHVVTNLHRVIEGDIRAGYFMSHFARPVSWLWTYLVQEGGPIPLYTVCVLMVGGTLAYVATGQFYLTPIVMGQVFIHLLLGAAIWISMTIIAGMTALWLRTSSMAYFIVQKAGFVLGGMLLPLSLYPEWLQHIVFYTPFPAIFYVPAQTILRGAHMMTFSEALMYQVIVLAAVWAVMVTMFRAFEYKILQEG